MKRSPPPRLQWGLTGGCRCCSLKVPHLSSGYFLKQTLGQWMRRIQRQREDKCSVASPSTLSLYLHSISHPPTPDVLVGSICLSWEEVPSHLTLRKWFQCMLVWILAGFCNCQFPYQSVCISIGKTWATSPLPLSSFVLVECSCCCRWCRLLTGLLDSAICWVCVCVFVLETDLAWIGRICWP